MLAVEREDIMFSLLTYCKDLTEITAERKYLQVALRNGDFKIVWEG